METTLTAALNLRILVTCRWPLGPADHETKQEVPSMAEDEARDVFSSHFDSSAHRFEVKETWEELDSAIRQLIRITGRQPPNRCASSPGRWAAWG
ncbi:MAG: hypothetical protein QF886_12450 [Planctomycetota bacterium]|nr:hypothetical protein [Planctomycetota bacterium]